MQNIFFFALPNGRLQVKRIHVAKNMTMIMCVLHPVTLRWRKRISVSIIG